MTKYVNLDEIDEILYCFSFPESSAEYANLISEIDSVAPADVEPVKKAEWVSVRDGYGVCSNCNRGDHIDPLARFCRFCGAEMREVKVDG